MKIVLFGFFLFGFLSCSENQFCGNSVPQDEYSNLTGKVVGNGFNVAIQLAFTVAQKLGEDFKPQFEIDYSTQDTLVLNIKDIPNEDTAKKISCIVSENEIVKNTKLVYAKFNWKEGSQTIKF